MLTQDWYFGYVAKRRRVSVACVYLDEPLAHVLGAEVATDGLGTVEIQNFNVLFGVVGEVALE